MSEGLLFGLTRPEWAAQSGLTETSYGIADHCHKALYDLTSVNADLNFMMWTYLRSEGIGNDNLGISDLLLLWDGTFGGGTTYYLLLETGGTDNLLLETGDNLLLETAP